MRLVLSSAANTQKARKKWKLHVHGSLSQTWVRSQSFSSFTKVTTEYILCVPSYSQQSPPVVKHMNISAEKHVTIHTK